MTKAPDAFRTISEVAAELDLPQHVLRFWESRFPQIKPMKRGGGRRYYRPDDVELLRGIRHLLYGQGYTIRGVQRILREQGPRFVQGVWQEGAPQPEYGADQDGGENEIEITEAEEAEASDDSGDGNAVQAAPAPPVPPAPPVEPRLEPRFEAAPEAESLAPEEARRELAFAPVESDEAGETREAPIHFVTESDAGNGHERPAAIEPEPVPAPVPAAVTVPAPVPVQMTGMSDGDRERLLTALEELAECRRLLGSALVDAELEA